MLRPFLFTTPSSSENLATLIVIEARFAEIRVVLTNFPPTSSAYRDGMNELGCWKSDELPRLQDWVNKEMKKGGKTGGRKNEVPVGRVVLLKEGVEEAWGRLWKNSRPEGWRRGCRRDESESWV